MLASLVIRFLFAYVVLSLMGSEKEVSSVPAKPAPTMQILLTLGWLDFLYVPKECFLYHFVVVLGIWSEPSCVHSFLYK